MPGSFAQWQAGLERSRARRKALGLALTAASMTVGNLLLLVQLYAGGLRHLPWSGQLAWAALVWTGVSCVLMVAFPERFLPLAERVARAVLSAALAVVSTALLLVVYWLMLLPARAVGRRGFAARHPASSPWTYQSRPWQVPTWTAKEPDCELSQRWSANPLVQALAMFARRRDVFLLVALVVAFLAAALGMLAQSSVVAPMIYTLF